MEEKNKGGRPPLYTDPNKLLNDGLEYFKTTSTPTITGLCLHLGFESRQSFYDTENRDGFSYTIKRLRLMIENKYEMKLFDKEYATTGVIFALKNIGWSDKQEIDHTTQGNSVNQSPTIVFTKFRKEEG